MIGGGCALIADLVERVRRIELRVPRGGGDMEGGGFGGNGPLVAPGAYKARLTAGGVTKTESFTVKIDPRIAKDGAYVGAVRRLDGGVQRDLDTSCSYSSNSSSAPISHSVAIH